MNTIALPTGYTMQLAPDIEAQAMGQLFQPRETSDTLRLFWEHQLRVSKQILYVVGVRSSDEELIGSGLIRQEPYQPAELCNLKVREDHRGLGIGKFIVSNRIEAARDLGLDSLTVRFSRSNTLRDYYAALGFIGTSDTAAMKLV